MIIIQFRILSKIRDSINIYYKLFETPKMDRRLHTSVNYYQYFIHLFVKFDGIDKWHPTNVAQVTGVKLFDTIVLDIGSHQ